MGNLDIWYLAVLLALFLVVNIAFKKFPRNHEKLIKMITED